MHKETNPRGETVSSKAPAPLVPVSAEDFARRKRRIVFKWLGAALLAVLLGVWVYRSSQSSQEGQKAFDDGEQMLKTNRYAEAIQSFDRALALGGSSPASLYMSRGRANALLDQMEPAIKDFTKVIELRPKHPDAFLERAKARLAVKDYQGVVADCGEAISLDPKLPLAYTLRGTAFREAGGLPQALENFSRAVELSPGLDNYFQRAATYQLLGDHHRAIADLDQVIDLFPTSPMGYLARARSRDAVGDSAGAASDRETGRRLEERPPGQ